MAHSLSPLLHRYWLEEHGICGDYIALSLESSTFSVGLAFLQRVGFVGVNVTVPYKEAAFALAHHIDDAARLCGAVNLILFHAGGQIEGRNTDVAGLRASLAEEFGEECLKGNIAVILGAGGAARAAVLALDRLGVSEIRILSRNLSRALPSSVVGLLESGRGNYAPPSGSRFVLDRAGSSTALLCGGTANRMAPAETASARAT